MAAGHGEPPADPSSGGRAAVGHRAGDLSRRQPKVIAETVATPIEEAINGVDDMIYMKSVAASDGVMQLDVVFDIGTDVDRDAPRRRRRRQRINAERAALRHRPERQPPARRFGTQQLIDEHMREAEPDAALRQQPPVTAGQRGVEISRVEDGRIAGRRERSKFLRREADAITGRHRLEDG